MNLARGIIETTFERMIYSQIEKRAAMLEMGTSIVRVPLAVAATAAIQRFSIPYPWHNRCCRGAWFSGDQGRQTQSRYGYRNHRRIFVWYWHIMLPLHAKRRRLAFSVQTATLRFGRESTGEPRYVTSESFGVVFKLRLF